MKNTKDILELDYSALDSLLFILTHVRYYTELFSTSFSSFGSKSVPELISVRVVIKVAENARIERK